MQTKPGACRHVAHAITRQTKKSEFASSSPTSTAGRLRVGASPLLKSISSTVWLRSKLEPESQHNIATFLFVSAVSTWRKFLFLFSFICSSFNNFSVHA
jgi:hypothetical protein